MRTLRRAGLPALAVCLAFLSAAPADDKPDDKDNKEQKELDAAVRKSLYEVINHGAEIYNRGGMDECILIYDTALMTVEPLLGHHPKLQRFIQDGRATARRAQTKEDIAFRLREVLDDVRDALKAGGTLPEKKQKDVLWDRLGGEKGVAKIIDDFVDLAAKDPKVNFDRGGKYKLDATAVARLKRGLIDQFSGAFGGPYRYEGKSMAAVHKGMGITAAEFDASLADLKKALEKNGITEDDVKFVLTAVGGTRPQIVEKVAAKSLWERLGGDKGVEKIIDDFVEAARKDKDVNFDRNGKYKLDDEMLAKVKKEFVRQFSNIVGGPHKVDKNEKPPYKGLGITDAEFDAAAKQFRKALEKNGVKEDLNLIMVAVSGQRDEVVEPKKPDDKKPDDKKPDDKKPDDKPKDTATVEGKVLLEGQPVTGGKISFVGPDDKAVTGEIMKDGTYKVSGLKSGTAYHVTIEVPEKANQRFATAETTPLRLRCTGDQKGADYDLKK
jgi:hemoglobin